MDYSFFNGMNSNSEPDTGLGGSGAAQGGADSRFAPSAQNAPLQNPEQALENNGGQNQSQNWDNSRGTAGYDNAAFNPFAPPSQRSGSAFQSGPGSSGSQENSTPAPVNGQGPAEHNDAAASDPYAPASDSGMIHVAGTDSYAPAMESAAASRQSELMPAAYADVASASGTDPSGVSEPTASDPAPVQ